MLGCDVKAARPKSLIYESVLGCPAFSQAAPEAATIPRVNLYALIGLPIQFIDITAATLLPCERWIAREKAGEKLDVAIGKAHALGRQVGSDLGCDQADVVAVLLEPGQTAIKPGDD